MKDEIKNLHAQIAKHHQLKVILASNAPKHVKEKHIAEYKKLFKV